jgi:hypothetical protein
LPRPFEQCPGDLAATTGIYHQVNVAGSLTGKTIHLKQGERLPAAPIGFRWQAPSASEDDAAQQVGARLDRLG